MTIADILEKVRAGDLSPEEAIGLIPSDRESNLEFARVDTDRLRRRGFPEVVFGPGKTSDQISKIMSSLREHKQNILVSRATQEQFNEIAPNHPDAIFHEHARCITVDVTDLPPGIPGVTVVSAGTADLPVAEEAALVAERLGAEVDRVYDIGIAGLHRVLSQVERLRKANVLVIVAGMEGALPSVVGGLVDIPIIAVPTSVGYGTGADGLAALLSMLNTCVPGITVVNIDNGFGAGVSAAMINRRSIRTIDPLEG